MKYGRSSVSYPLSKQLLVKGFLPLIVVMLIALAINEFFYFKSQLQSENQKLTLLTQQIATKVEASNQQAVIVANTMAEAQVSGMFGQREMSSDYAQAVLVNNPQFTGAYFGYEVNADGNDASERYLMDEPPPVVWAAPEGRFIPYWFRDPENLQVIKVEPLKDMETSLYYQGVKDRFLRGHQRTALITEPYAYYGKLIVEHSTPIVIDGEFKGIAGVDRSLDDVLNVLKEARESNDVDAFLLSGSGRFIASTTLLNDQLRTRPVTDTVYRTVVAELASTPDATSIKLADPDDGKDYYFVASKIETGNWMVVVRKDALLISRPLWQTLGWLLGSSLLGIGVASFLLNRSLRSLKERIESAVTKVNFLSLGELPPKHMAHKDDIANRDEVSAIAEALDHVIEYYIDIDESCKKMAEGDFDISVEPKSQSDILAQSINTLAQKRAQAERAIVLARQQAEDANIAKGQFLANMSHEIRTPMNAIMGLSRLCLGTDIDGKSRNYVEKIYSSANFLLQIINDILDFSKIEAGKLELERTPFLLSDVFDHLVDATKVIASEKSLFPKIDLPDRNIVVWGDPLRLGQVLLNLLNNAIKFTSQGDITVQVVAEDCGEDRVKLSFSVSDTGIGISEEQQKNLFNVFGQADNSTSRKFGGSGLGLVICETLVSRMGGKLNVDSELGTGTKVSFSIILDCAHMDDVKHKRLPEELGHMHILWADGDPENRRIAMQQLHRLGVANTTVRNGREVINALSETENGIHYDLLVLESELVDMSAAHLMDHIRIKNDLEEVAVVIVANDTEYKPPQTEGSPIIGVLTRPVTDSDLFDALVNFVSSTPERVLHKSWQIEHDDALADKHVLLVEDNPVNQLIAQDLIEQLGMQVSTAENGKVAIEKLNQQSYDAVLMDLQMPVMDGLEATTVIRKNTAFNTMPIIAMTANAMERQKSECLSLGMNDFIPKPIDFDLFKKVMRTWLAGPLKGASFDEPEPQENRPSNINLVHLDVDDALQRAGHIKSKLTRLLDIFHQHHSADGNKILAAIDAGESDSAAKIAHSLAGVAAYIGAHRLAKFSRDSEKQLSGVHGAIDSELKTQLLSEIEAVKREVSQLKTYLDETSQGPSEDEDVYVSTLMSDSNHQATDAESTPLTLLIVDDDRLQLDVLLDFFEDKYRVITAGDGKTCLEKAKRYTPDLIVLDMALPLMNGNQICELLKADESTSDIPIIFISSKPSIETECLTLGAVDFILKPLEREVVLARVGRHIETKRQADKRAQQAGIDELTSFANLDLYTKLATTELARCAREQKPISFILLTILNLADVNTSYSKQQVNDSLVALAQAITQTFGRPGDILARTHANQFVCVLPGAKTADGSMLLRRLNNAIMDNVVKQHLPHQMLSLEFKWVSEDGTTLTQQSLAQVMANARVYDIT